MVLKLGKYSYSHEYKEIGDLDNKETNVGNFSSINSLSIIGYKDSCYSIGNISNFPFLLYSPELFELDENLIKNNINKQNTITKIGNDVWIGSGVMIKCGIEIGNGSIIGYNSYVTENIPPYCVVAGNPATIIRKRYSDDIIEKLLKIQWWNWPDKKIRQNADYFMYKTINEFVEKFN